MQKDFTKEEKLRCLKTRIIRCVDVNDSDSLRQLLVHGITGVSQQPAELSDLAHQVDKDSLEQLLGVALIDAAVKNSPEVIETLLDLGAPIDFMDEFKHTAILRAAEFGHIDVVRLLCYRGCDTNVCDSWTRTPIHWAAHSRHTEVVRELLAHGALPDPVDKNYQFTPLMLAARMGKTEIVRMLLERSREIVPDPKCLLCSTPPGPAQFIIENLDASKQTTRKDSDCTPEETACASGSSTKRWNLRQESYDVAAETSGSKKEIHRNDSQTSQETEASRESQTNLPSIFAQLLSDTNKKLPARDSWRDPSHLSRSHQEVLMKSLKDLYLCKWHLAYPRSALLQRARDINHTDIHGENPIFDASRQGHWNIVDMLIDEGCNVNHVAKFRGRQTAPILIARNSKNAVEMLVKLVRLNCDLELTGSSHFFGYWNLPAERITAFQLALMDGHILATKILALGGAKLTPPASDNWLSAFVEKEHQDWVLDLLFNPRSLKHCCRIEVRRCLGVKPYDAIDALPLPVAVKHHLTIPELYEFEQYFVKPTFA